MHVDLQLLQQPAVVGSVHGEAAERDGAKRMQVDLVGEARQMVLALAEVLGEGHHGLAGRAEILDGGADGLDVGKGA